MTTGPSPRPEILRIHPYVAGESSVAGVNRTIKLSSNEGAFGIPPAARKAIEDAVGETYRYPDGGAEALHAALGKRWGLDPARIVCGAGSDDLLYQLCLSYGGAGRDIVMSAHGFTIYEIAGTYAGSRVIKVPERNLCTDLDAMLAAVTDATRLVFIANPNNPTGSMLSAAEVARFRQRLPEHVLLVIDAAYAEYVDRDDYDAGASLVDTSGNTVMTRTFSKMFGLAGLRVGWCYAPPAVASVLNRVRGTFNVSVLGQAAAIASLSDPHWVDQCKAHNTKYRQIMTDSLRAAGIKVWPSVGNFVLADFESVDRANAADAFLRTRGIIVRKVGPYGLPHCLRITIGTAEETNMLIDGLMAFAHG